MRPQRAGVDLVSIDAESRIIAFAVGGVRVCARLVEKQTEERSRFRWPGGKQVLQLEPGIFRMSFLGRGNGG